MPLIQKNKNEIIFDISSIEYEEISKYIINICSPYDKKVNLNDEQKTRIQIFTIFYVSYKFFSQNYEIIKEKGFEYKTICEFYYNISQSYNKAIEGFNELKIELSNTKVNN